MLIPQLKRRTVTTSLMRNVAAAEFRPLKRQGDAIVSLYTPKMVEMYRRDHGKTPL